jgi:hypothetical protein
MSFPLPTAVATCDLPSVPVVLTRCATLLGFPLCMRAEHHQPPCCLPIHGRRSPDLAPWLSCACRRVVIRLVYVHGVHSHGALRPRLLCPRRSRAVISPIIPSASWTLSAPCCLVPARAQTPSARLRLPARAPASYAARREQAPRCSASSPSPAPVSPAVSPVPSPNSPPSSLRAQPELCSPAPLRCAPCACAAERRAGYCAVFCPMSSLARFLFLCSIVHRMSSLLPIVPSIPLEPFAFIEAPWLDSAQFASCSSLRRARSVPLFLRVLLRSSLFSLFCRVVMRAKFSAHDCGRVHRIRNALLLIRLSSFRAPARNPKNRVKTKLVARYSPSARQIAWIGKSLPISWIRVSR